MPDAYIRLAYGRFHFLDRRGAKRVLAERALFAALPIAGRKRWATHRERPWRELSQRLESSFQHRSTSARRLDYKGESDTARVGAAGKRELSEPIAGPASARAHIGGLPHLLLSEDRKAHKLLAATKKLPSPSRRS